MIFSEDNNFQRDNAQKGGRKLEEENKCQMGYGNLEEENKCQMGYGNLCSCPLLPAWLWQQTYNPYNTSEDF